MQIWCFTDISIIFTALGAATTQSYHLFDYLYWLYIQSSEPSFHIVVCSLMVGKTRTWPLQSFWTLKLRWPHMFDENSILKCDFIKRRAVKMCMFFKTLKLFAHPNPRLPANSGSTETISLMGTNNVSNEMLISWLHLCPRRQYTLNFIGEN